MTILVTGSAGHLGEALMRTFRASGRPAVGIDIKPSPFTDRVGTIADRGFVHAVMAGVRSVIHAATLHKPHIVTHSRQDFVDTNVTGTLNLLEEAAAAAVDAFVYTSTTSTFGAALSAGEDQPAAWITEDVTPIAKNIYGVTKLAAEGLCELFARRHGLAVIALRTSRFFPEADDNPDVRARYDIANVQANELLYRRADIADVVDAHLLSLERARASDFRFYVVSATTPFRESDLAGLRRDAPAVIERLYPGCTSLFEARGWRLFPTIDRVYVNTRAKAELGWQPRCDFAAILDCLRSDRDFRSPLAQEVGSKGYHDRSFGEEPYPVA